MNVLFLLIAIPWVAAAFAVKGFRNELFPAGDAVPSQASQSRGFGSR